MQQNFETIISKRFSEIILLPIPLTKKTKMFLSSRAFDCYAHCMHKLAEIKIVKEKKVTFETPLVYYVCCSAIRLGNAVRTALNTHTSPKCTSAVRWATNCLCSLHSSYRSKNLTNSIFLSTKESFCVLKQKL